MKSVARIQYELACREFYYSVALYKSIRDSGDFDRNIFFNARRSLAIRI